jgi:WXG100 family type VII secretion target
MANDPIIGDVAYHVTLETLNDAVGHTRSTADEVDTNLGLIRGIVNSLEGRWQGVAHQTFQTLMAEYDVYAKMLHDSLVDIASGLQGNYVNYSESEQANINNLRSLDATLPARNQTIPPPANLA